MQLGFVDKDGFGGISTNKSKHDDKKDKEDKDGQLDLSTLEAIEPLRKDQANI